MRLFTSSPHSAIEPLELRIAPAALVSIQVVDFDDDLITVTSSRGTAADLQAAITLGSHGKGIASFSLAGKGIFKGADITITAAAPMAPLIPTTADIGSFDATGIDLGAVRIAGDVGQIDGGDTRSATPAFRTLEVQSLGLLGTTLQGPGGDVESVVFGGIRTLTIHGDIAGFLTVAGGRNGVDGKIGTLTVGGTLQGGAAPGSGSIVVTGTLGTAEVGGALIGGAGEGSGSINSGGTINLLEIEGDVRGGAGLNSGAIRSGGSITAVRIDGSLIGDAAASSLEPNGTISARGTIILAAIDGSVVGGAAANSGNVRAGSGGIKLVTITGDLQGGAGFESGSVGSSGIVKKVAIEGSISGGVGGKSGSVLSTASIGLVEIGGSIEGGEGANSGSVASDGGIGKVFVTRDLLGGAGPQSGSVGSIRPVGEVEVKGDLRGGAGDFSGLVVSGAAIRSVTVRGDVVGAEGSNSATIQALGAILKVRIEGSLIGGEGFGSGSVRSSSSLPDVFVGKDVQGAIVELDPPDDGGTSLVPELLNSYTTPDSELVGAAYDQATATVWVYAGQSEISSYSASGDFLASIPSPGGPANDADLEFAPEALTLGSVSIPAGTLLMINGESGPAEIYALDKSTGAILATLATSYGSSHVVGGAYHPARNSFFLVQDNVPGGPAANQIAEVSATTGAVLQTFQLSSFGFSVSFGDLAISTATGNLYVVSSVQGSVLELTPQGVFVQFLQLPSGVSQVSGIGLDESTGEAWLTSRDGSFYQVSGIPASSPPVIDFTGNQSGSIRSLGTMGTVVIQGDLRGGNLAQSGVISATGLMRSVTVEGSLIGGGAFEAGAIRSGGEMRAVVIKGDLQGGTAINAGIIYSNSVITSMRIEGNVIGGSGTTSGTILNGTFIPEGSAKKQPDIIKVAVLGNVIGGLGDLSGRISSLGNIRSVEIGTLTPLFGGQGEVAIRTGALVGGQGSESGSIHAEGGLGKVLVHGDVRGSSGGNSGKISSDGNIDRITIEGELNGGGSSYGFAGPVRSEGQIFAEGHLRSVIVQEGIQGGRGAFSAQIRAGSIGSVQVGTRVQPASVSGGGGQGSASIVAEGSDIGSVLIYGNLSSGLGSLSGSIQATRNLGSVVADAMIGSGEGDVYITAAGRVSATTGTQSAAIGSVTVARSFEGVSILAGVDLDLALVNRGAAIGSILLGKTGLRGSEGEPVTPFLADFEIRAGALAGSVPQGISRIASIVINGSFGTTDGSTITARQVVAVTVNGVKEALTAGADNDNILLSGDPGERTFLAETFGNQI